MHFTPFLATALFSITVIAGPLAAELSEVSEEDGLLGFSEFNKQRR